MTARIDPPDDDSRRYRSHTHEELSRFRAAMDMCGDALYLVDRKAMHERAKVFQDSIANVIRTTMAEAEGPAPVNAAPIDTSRKMINPNQVNK